MHKQYDDLYSLFFFRFLRGHHFTYSHLLLWQKWTIFLTENQQHNAHLIHASKKSYLKSVESKSDEQLA